MMKSKRNRFLSVLLTLCLCAGLFAAAPLTALGAVDEGTPPAGSEAADETSTGGSADPQLPAGDAEETSGTTLGDAAALPGDDPAAGPEDAAGTPVSSEETTGAAGSGSLSPLAASIVSGVLTIEPTDPDASGTGWVWDNSSHTLTLSGSYPGNAIHFVNPGTPGTPVEIIINGAVSVTAAGSRGVWAEGDMTIGGTGSLTVNVTAGTSGGNGENGVDASGALTITDAALTLNVTTDGNFGIGSGGDLTINGSTVNATGRVAISPYAGKLWITNGANVTATSTGYGSVLDIRDSGEVVVDSGTTVKLINEHATDYDGFVYLDDFVSGKLSGDGASAIKYFVANGKEVMAVVNLPAPGFLDPDNARYSSYSGAYLGISAAEPILIQTVSELQQIYRVIEYQYEQWDLLGIDIPIYVKLTAPVYDLGGGWNPVDLYGEGWRIFIDGNNAKIINLSVVSAAGGGPQYFTAGLFSEINDVEIKNLTFISPEVYGLETAGALAGEASNSYLSGIQVTGANIRSGGYAGGVVGYAYYGTVIKNSGVTSGTVVIEDVWVWGGYWDDYAAGGVVGVLEASLVFNCYNYAAVSVDEIALGSSDPIYAGGVVGYINAINRCIFNSYSLGNVTVNAANTSADIGVGGIAGYLQDNAVNNYAGGTVSGPASASIGQAFGIVYGDDSAGDADAWMGSQNITYVIEGNYYTGTGDGIGSYEDSNGTVAPAGTTQQITDRATLLSTLNSGRADIINFPGDTHGLTEEFLDANTLTWTITGNSYFGVGDLVNPVHGDDTLTHGFKDGRDTFKKNGGETKLIHVTSKNYADSAKPAVYVLIDGVPTQLTEGNQFTFVHGSTEVHLNEAWLELHPLGAHVLRVAFADGTVVEDPFTVHEAAVPLAAPSSPATGDESAPLGWLFLMMFSALALLTVVRKARLVN